MTANSLSSCADTTLQHHLCMGEDQAFYMHTTNLLYWQVFIITGGLVYLKDRKQAELGI